MERTGTTKRRRRAISKDMRSQMHRSVANLATIVASAKARADVAEAVEKAQKKAEEATKTITAPTLENGGKLKPAKEPNSGVHELTEGEQPETPATKTEKTETFKLFCPVFKVNTEQRTVTGVVLQPEVVDAQGDIISAEVIEKAAENFLAKFNKATKLGFMHKNFSKKFELLQSYIMPSDLAMGTKVVPAGAWVMKVRVIDNQVWKSVKEGKITGFSIGGKAKVVKLAAA